MSLEIFKSNEVAAAAIGALLGSSSAFLLVVIRDSVKSVNDRKRKHYDALVRLEAQLQDQGGVIYDNLYLIPFFSGALKRGSIYWSNLSRIEFDKSLLIELHNTVLINEVFSYYSSLRKINDDIKGVSEAYKTIERALIEKHINDQTYLLNAKNLAANLEQIKSFLQDLQDDILIHLIAHVRVLLQKDKTPFIGLKRTLVGATKVEENEIKKETKKVMKEIEETKKESRERIDRLTQDVQIAQGQVGQKSDRK